jgi:formamidopyrimidine-DNA glycosylase
VPELPEVERVRRILHRVLAGKIITEAEIVPDEIVLQGVDPEAVKAQLLGSRVMGTGRRGKYWWLEIESAGCLFGHLGMAGWIREVGVESIRIREQGEAPLDDDEGRPRFLKMRLRAEDGREVVMTDGRRLARLWQGESPETDRRVSALGPDMYDSPWSVDDLLRVMAKKKAPVKAILLDQTLFAGVGNWIADEVLYQARISPKRLGNTLDRDEVAGMIDSLRKILKLAVDVEADKDQFPVDWLFHARWGGGKGEEMFRGEPLVREQVGGRTTAWVPNRQR